MHCHRNAGNDGGTIGRWGDDGEEVVLFGEAAAPVGDAESDVVDSNVGDCRRPSSHAVRRVYRHPGGKWEREKVRGSKSGSVASAS